MNEGSKALSDFIFQSKYARYIPSLGRKETFEESVDRIYNMHIQHLEKNYPHALNSAEFNNDFIEAIDAYKRMEVFGSQRALQFGGDPILKKNCKLFNCAFTYCDRLEVFKEIEWVLLCGCGAGISIEFQHINKLPKMIENLSSEVVEYKISDDIEGWSYAIQALINYYFIKNSPYPKFDYSLIRPKGSLISGGFVAPGPAGLKNSLTKIQEILDYVHKTTKKLLPIHCADIIAHCADSVLSGGLRRSAVILLFSPNDTDMLNAKTGNWFYDNPQRGRFNASAVLERGETEYNVFSNIFKYTKQFGEPGFLWRSNKGLGVNPCGEIGFVPVYEGKTGWQFCNLSFISGIKIETEEDFYIACKNVTTLATIQASYQKFEFLGDITEALIKSDPLIGVSISGVMTNPDILLNPEILRRGADIVKNQNLKIASLLKINPSSRCTTIKPDGNASVLTGNTPGCHGEHARRYIRRVQVNKEEEAGQIYKKFNPKAVVESVWSNNHTDDCIMFAIEANPKAILKSELLGIEQLEAVKLLYNNWILPGSRDSKSTIQNNVSNTVTVPEDSWLDVEQYIWDNQNFIAGVSFIPETGDLDFTQPPYTEVLLPSELVDRYGEGVIFASGLIVDAEKIFGDLWKACDTFNHLGEKLYATSSDVEEFIKQINVSKNPELLNKPHSEWIKAYNQEYDNWVEVLTTLNYSEEFIDDILDSDIEIPYSEVKKYLDKTAFTHVANLSQKRDIMRRMKKYADKYFGSDYQMMINALKYVQLYHDWCDITKTYVPIDWTEVKWKNVLLNADEMAGGACAGGACEITKL